MPFERLSHDGPDWRRYGDGRGEQTSGGREADGQASVRSKGWFSEQLRGPGWVAVGATSAQPRSGGPRRLSLICRSQSRRARGPRTAELLEAPKGPCKFLIVLDNQECRNPVKQETAAARYGKNPATFKDVAETLRQAGEPAKLAKRESLLDRAKSQFKITVKRLDPAVVAFVVYRIGLCIPERLL